MSDYAPDIGTSDPQAVRALADRAVVKLIELDAVRPAEAGDVEAELDEIRALAKRAQEIQPAEALPATIELLVEVVRARVGRGGSEAALRSTFDRLEKLLPPTSAQQRLERASALLSGAISLADPEAERRARGALLEVLLVAPEECLRRSVLAPLLLRRARGDSASSGSLTQPRRTGSGHGRPLAAPRGPQPAVG